MLKIEIMSIEICAWNMIHTRLNDNIFNDNVVVVVILDAVIINDDDASMKTVPSVRWTRPA